MQASNLLLGVLLTRHVAHTIGAERLGISAFGLAVTGYMVNFAHLGISIYGMREVAKYRDDPQKLQEIFSRGITYQSFFSLIAIAIFVTWAFMVQDGNTQYYLLFLLTLLAHMTDLSWLYGGLERFDKVALRTVTTKILGTTAIFFTVSSPNHLGRMIILEQGALLLSNLFFWLPLRRYGLRIHYAPLKETLRNMLKPALTTFAPIVLNSSMWAIDRLLLGHLAQKRDVAVYDYSTRLARLGNTISATLGSVMLPKVAAIQKLGNPKRLHGAIADQMLFGLLFSMLIGGGLISTAGQICTMLLGPTFIGAREILLILAISVLPQGMGLYHIALAIGREKQLIPGFIALLIASIALFIPLILNYGVRGLAVGSVTIQYLEQLFYCYVLRDVIDFRKFLKTILLALVILITSMIVTHPIHHTNIYLDFLVRAAVYVPTFLLLTFVIFRDFRMQIRLLIRAIGEKVRLKNRRPLT